MCFRSEKVVVVRFGGSLQQCSVLAGYRNPGHRLFWRASIARYQAPAQPLKGISD
jgi:hypothetical protein